MERIEALNEDAAIARQQLDTSHLCHFANCFNPSHLRVESRMRNNGRTRCGMRGWCKYGFTPFVHCLNKTLLQTMALVLKEQGPELCEGTSIWLTYRPRMLP